MMTIVDARYHEMHWSGHLKDAPITTKRYGSAQLRPFKIDIRYRASGGQWEAYAAVISGPLVKKDGTDGKTWVSSEYWFNISKSTPQWIIDTATTYTPKVKP